MKIASRNTAEKQTFARGSANTLRKPSIMVASRNARGLGNRDIAERKERRDRDNKSEQAEHHEDAAPAEQVADHARDRGAKQVAGKADGEQAADRDLPLADRNEVADERHARPETLRRPRGRP